MDRLNPYTLPLSGRHLIEASAGTGKTYNAVILWLRASIELDLMPHQVLLVTFTRAAVAELADRLKARITELLKADPADELYQHFLDQGMDEAQLNQRLIQRLQTLDDAAVTTLHGWAGQSVREFDRLVSFEVADALPALRAQALERAWRAQENYMGNHAQWLTYCQKTPDETLNAKGNTAQRNLANLFNYKNRHIEPALSYTQARDQFLGCLSQCEPEEKGSNQDIRDLYQAIAEQNPETISRTKTDKIKKLGPEFHELIESARILVGAIRRALFLRWEAEFEALKRATRQCEADDQVKSLRRAIADPEFAQTMADRWPVALVDEFQDTDPDQLAILRAVYQDRGLLLMIGDPKQALYSFRGGDIAAYNSAKAWVASESRHSIDQCFRMSKALVEQLNQLYQSVESPFSGAAEYQPITAGRDTGALSQGGQILEPMRWINPDPGTIAAGCAELLNSHTTGPDGQPLGPQDIAILVNNWSEGTQLRSALARFGLGASVRISHNRESQGFLGFAQFVRACESPRDGAKVRALVPYAISGIGFQRWLPDPKLSLDLTQRVAKSAQLWQDKGAVAAARAFVLSGPDLGQVQSDGTGMTAIAEFLDLAERVCDLTPADALRWLQRPMWSATHAPLPSDDPAVVITTIHSSKGLEFPVVFVPGPPKSKKPAIAIESDGVRTRIDLAPDAHALARAREQQDAERQRLMYVAVTRAKHLLVIGRDQDKPADLLEAWDESFAKRWHPKPPPAATQATSTEPLPAGYDGRALADHWRVHSFSGWIAGADLAHVSRADHDLDGPAGAYPKGPQAGDVLHRLLEWRLNNELDSARAEPLLSALGVEDIAGTLEWIEQIVSAPVLPGQASMLEVPRIAEMDFHFALGAVDGAAFDAAVQRHWGLPARSALPADYLSGLMKGSLDVTLRADGRYWVLDFKSNFLGAEADYTQAAMQGQIAQHRYDVQAAIYLVALHRLLRLRLDDYDPAVHLGGAIYHFVRVPSALETWHIRPEAILELEALLCPTT